ncbi:hypothetical protein FM042_06085 [Aliidiomarina halalkaliphila]|uniref:General secretion pathway protein F n=1 Tax=Aliidiomarina halalkaliphila TaxID=2593535 RepID=A0A552X5V3_9GAMM|nr:type II secretion system F family protein [Aliidiomarina halalkaliphila]TRW50395.1 hypothetical protein FM042_06085 [Aliidiomarina halalkaliphila]
MQASNRTQVRTRLAQQQIHPQRVTPLGRLPSGHAHRQWQLQFLYQWYELLTSGFDQQSAWQYLHRNSAHRESAAATHSILRQLQHGESLASALAQHPIFPPHLGMWVGVGEHTGRLPQVLYTLHHTLQSQLVRSQRLRAALRYPLLVLAVAVLMIITMVAFLLPRFAEIYTQLNVTLPQLTHALLQLNNPSLLIIIAVVLMVLFGFTLVLGRRWHGWLYQARSCTRIYRLPLLGSYLRRFQLLQDLRMLTLALDSHIPLHESMQYMARFSDSGYWRERWQRCGKMLETGVSFLICSSRIGIPNPLCQAIAIGEASGRLTTQLGFAITQLERQQDEQQQRFLGLLPTLVLIVVSIITLLLLLALYLPLFQLGQIVG